MPGAFTNAPPRRKMTGTTIVGVAIRKGPAGPRRVIYMDRAAVRLHGPNARRTPAARSCLVSGALAWSPPATAWTPANLARAAVRLRRRRKAALLEEQPHHARGLVGKHYVCEAMWRAGLSPLKPAGRLVGRTGKPKAALAQLTEAIRAVISEAIAAGGSSLRDHIRTDGTLGYFQHGFSVYDREGKACPRPGCGDTVRRIVQSGRSTFYCPRCQKN